MECVPRAVFCEPINCHFLSVPIHLGRLFCEDLEDEGRYHLQIDVAKVKTVSKHLLTKPQLTNVCWGLSMSIFHVISCSHPHECLSFATEHCQEVM